MRSRLFVFLARPTLTKFSPSPSRSANMLNSLSLVYRRHAIFSCLITNTKLLWLKVSQKDARLIGRSCFLEHLSRVGVSVGVRRLAAYLLGSCHRLFAKNQRNCKNIRGWRVLFFRVSDKCSQNLRKKIIRSGIVRGLRHISYQKISFVRRGSIEDQTL